MDDTTLAVVVLAVAAMLIGLGLRTMKMEEKDAEEKTDGRWTHRE